MATIHPTAIIERGAELASDVTIGPFCYVGPNVVIGQGSRLFNHATVTGYTRMGTGNVVHPHAVIGGPPQDLKYKNEPTRLEVGDNNIFRENVTVNTGTMQDKNSGGLTRLGSHNLLMVNTHIGHDCDIGSYNVLANNVMLAGHILCGDRVIMNGGVGVHQFVTVGELSYIAGYAQIHHDVPPFLKVCESDRVRALNSVGLKRAGHRDEDVDALEEAFRILFVGRRPLAAGLAEVHSVTHMHPLVHRLVTFIEQRDQGKNGRYREKLR